MVLQFVCVVISVPRWINGVGVKTLGNRQFFTGNACLLAGKVSEKYGWANKAMAYADAAAIHTLHDPLTDQRPTNIVQAQTLRGRYVQVH
jgi:hypothetical protein